MKSIFDTMPEIENGQYKLNIEQRMTRVETRLDDVVEEHLPHIQKDVSDIKDRLAYYTGGLAVLMIVAQFLVPYMLK